MASLAEIRARLAQQDNRSNREGGGDNSIFPHWNIPEGTSARLRFLPDKDEANPWGFWVEQLKINLPFAGVKGQPDSKPVAVQVPCVEMWQMACPILAEVRTWFKDPAMEEMGRKYWKKRSYLFQGFVRDNPLKEDKTPENPIRRFIISPQIFTLVKSALTDPDLENLPTDYEGGLDFVISKTSKGGYADYNTSKWARKESPLNQDELEAIDKFGLYNLADFLPKKPSDADLKVLMEMFEASLDGQTYDQERWGNYFKPRGLGGSTSAGGSAEKKAPTKQEQAPASSASDDDEVPFDTSDASSSVASSPVETKPAGGARRADELLAAIRNRAKS